MTAIVAVLAGGRGSRIGGDKAVVSLAGRPLIEYPLAAALDAGLEAVVVAKRTTQLPQLDVPVLFEPDEPTHPLLGIITALGQHPTIVALPCDMPFVSPEQLSALCALTADLAALSPGQPFPSLYRAAVLPQLREALEAGQSMRAVQAHSRHAPTAVSFTDAVRRSRDAVNQFSVNTWDDLAEAELLLSSR